MGLSRAAAAGVVGIAIVLLATVGSAAAATPAQVQSTLSTIEQMDDPDVVSSRPDLLGGELGMAGGRVPGPHHELGASVGVFSRVVMFQARLFATVGRWIVGVATGAVSWVLDFRVGTHLAAAVTSMAGAVHTRAVGPLGLAQLALLVAVGHAGWALLRDDLGAGMGGLALALGIAALAAGTLNNLDAVACSGLDVLGGTTHAILSLSSDVEPADGAAPLATCSDADDSTGTEAARPSPMFSNGLRDISARTFLHDPFLLLQWGAVPDPDSACGQVADALLARGSWGDDDFPRDRMREVGCDDLADFNADAGAERVVGALAYALACAAFGLAVIRIVATLLVAQVSGGFLVVALPVVLAIGIAPGPGRELLHRWVAAVVRVAMLFVAAAVFLVLLLLAVSATQTGLDDQPVLVRMWFTVAMAWSVVVVRRQLFTNLQASVRPSFGRARDVRAHHLIRRDTRARAGSHRPGQS